MANMIKVQGRYLQAPARCIALHPFLAQQCQCLLHRLPGNAQLFGQLLLNNSLAWQQAPVSDFGKDGFVNLLYQIGTRVQRFDASNGSCCAQRLESAGPARQRHFASF